MKTIVVLLAIFLMATTAHASVTTAREWLAWSEDRRSYYFIGAVDAIGDIVGLRCPPGSSYLIGRAHAETYAYTHLDEPVMGAVGYGMLQAGCTTVPALAETRVVLDTQHVTGGNR